MIRRRGMRGLALKIGSVILLAAFLAGCATAELHEKNRIIEQREITQ